MKHVDRYAETGDDFGLGRLLMNPIFEIIGLVSEDLSSEARRYPARLPVTLSPSAG
jgi:hypothetical protein